MINPPAVRKSARVQFDHKSLADAPAVAKTINRIQDSISNTLDAVVQRVNSWLPLAVTASTGFPVFSGQRMEWQAAVPTAGVWSRGDVVWNTLAAPSGPPGWVCVSGGSPGTWKAMANLAP